MRVNVAGMSTQYQSIGHGEVVVLLHGWGCDWQIWHTLIAPLSEHFQLLIPDLPAFGQSSDPQTAWTSLDYVTWLSEFLHQVAPSKKYSLIGHSFGGKIAALWSVSHRDQTQKLILIDSAGLPNHLTASQQLKQSLIALIPAGFKNGLSGSTRLKVLQRLGLSTDYAASSNAQRRILKKVVHENIAEQLSLIKVPTLLLWGANDRETPLAQGQRFQHLIPGSAIMTLPDGGHFPFFDNPSWCVTQIRNFLTQHD